MSKLFQFKPTKEIFAVLASWILVVSAFYLAFHVITIQRVALNFITFGVIGISLFGIALPVIWTAMIKKRSLAELGIKKDKLVISIILGIILSVVQYFLTIRNIEIPATREMVPLIAMSLAVGFYENIFYRGWVQLRMEEFFGIIPGIALSAVIYALYHIGYGMPANEIIILFIVGFVYSTIFRMTTNIFILFPFLTPTGALFTQIKDGLRLPFEATFGFADVIVLCAVILIVINKVSKNKTIPNKNTDCLLRSY